MLLATEVASNMIHYAIWIQYEYGIDMCITIFPLKVGHLA